MTPAEKLRSIVRNAADDSLERAKAAFRDMTDAELDAQHGQSGVSRREILRGYEKERAEYLAAAALLDELLRGR